jgi:spore cortex formation protein SpoVR/YcgB (stage V sporulation)
MGDITHDEKLEIAKTSDDIIMDENGKEFYKEKIEPHYSKFRWIKNRKVPVYADESKFADPITYLYSHEFVEIVDGKIGLELTRIRVAKKERGYVEGFTKNKFLFDTDYYSEPYNLPKWKS